MDYMQLPLKPQKAFTSAVVLPKTCQRTLMCIICNSNFNVFEGGFRICKMYVEGNINAHGKITWRLSILGSLLILLYLQHFIALYMCTHSVPV